MERKAQDGEWKPEDEAPLTDAPASGQASGADTVDRKADSTTPKTPPGKEAAPAAGAQKPAGAGKKKRKRSAAKPRQPQAAPKPNQQAEQPPKPAERPQAAHELEDYPAPLRPSKEAPGDVADRIAQTIAASIKEEEKQQDMLDELRRLTPGVEWEPIDAKTAHHLMETAPRPPVRPIQRPDTPQSPAEPPQEQRQDPRASEQEPDRREPPRERRVPQPERREAQQGRRPPQHGDHAPDVTQPESGERRQTPRRSRQARKAAQQASRKAAEQEKRRLQQKQLEEVQRPAPEAPPPRSTQNADDGWAQLYRELQTGEHRQTGQVELSPLEINQGFDGPISPAPSAARRHAAPPEPSSAFPEELADLEQPLFSRRTFAPQPEEPTAPPGMQPRSDQEPESADVSPTSVPDRPLPAQTASVPEDARERGADPEELGTEPTGGDEPDAPETEEPEGAFDSAEQRDGRRHDGAPRSESKAKKARTQNLKTQERPQEKSDADSKGSHQNVELVFGTMFESITSRQRRALPSNKASVRAAAEGYAAASDLGRMLFPLRVVCGVLLALLTFGRKIPILAPGALGQMGGVYFAIILTILAMVTAWRSVQAAVLDVLSFRISYETLLLVSTILALFDALIFQNTVSLIGFLGIAWCFAGRADAQRSRARAAMLANVVKRNKSGVFCGDALWHSHSAVGKREAGSSGLVRHTEEPDGFKSLWSILSPVLFLLTLILALVFRSKTELPFLSAWVALLAACLPVCGALTGALPLGCLGDALRGMGAVSGWHGAKRLTGEAAMLVYDADLFPGGTVSASACKATGIQTSQTLCSYAASLISQADNGLAPAFDQLLQEVGGQYLAVANFQFSDGGLTGNIQGNEVALGRSDFMRINGVNVEGGSKSDIHIAVNRQPAGVFSMKYQLAKGTKGTVARMHSEKNLKILIAAKNFTVNPAAMERWFQIPADDVECPKADTRRKLSEPAFLSKAALCGYVSRDGLTAYGRVVLGGRKYYRSVWLSTCVTSGVALVCLVLTIWRLLTGAVSFGPMLLLIGLVWWIVMEVLARIFSR